jgi:transcriptional regulator with XRE-family HTH domain
MRNVACYGWTKFDQGGYVEDPAMGPSEVLAKQVLVWRKRRNLSVQALADRISDLGGTLSRVAISRIENGNRSVSLDEWLLLAHVLAVPPVLLFVDLEGGGDVAIAPAVTLHPWLVWQWATGQEPPIVRRPGEGSLVTRVEEFGQALTARRLYREEESAANAVQDARALMRRAEFVGEPDAQAAARSAFIEALAMLAKLFDEMIENGITPPGKSPLWIERIRESGLSKYPERLTVYVAPGDDDGER